MPKDFASQARKPQAKKRRTKTKQKRPRKSNNSPMFHGPSFSAGTIIGAIIVFTMAYAPELLVNNSAKLSEVGGATKETEQIIEITFPQLLRESEVSTNTSTYQVAAIRKNPDPNSSSIRYQAASFRNPEDAEKLRARLLLNNLDANITVKRLNQIDWHRVVIGPFKDPGSAMTAKSKLNELNIPAIPLQQEN